ncbi:hypothetical protein ACIPUC_20925, partial [Streptomyces sp. LARHCF249]
LDEKVKAISSGGAAVATKTSDVHTSFGGIQAFYQAPEADQLFATTKPVSDLGLKLSSDMCTIAGALGTYSRDAAPVIKKLENLKAEAQAFRRETDKDEKWREDGDLIDENLERRNKIAEVWAEFHDVERACHAKIVALVGGTPLKKDDGSHGEGMYGYDADVLKASKSLPWGDAVEESIPGWQIWEHGWEFTKGFFVDGVWGTLKGLGGLVGLQGWDTFKQSWAGLGKLATGLSIALIPGVGPLFMAMPDDKLPSYLRESRTAMKETGKALLAWDQWGSNPGRAAGAVTFNVITTIATGGTGGAVSGAGKAGAVAKALSLAGKTGRVVDPMTYIMKGAGAGITKAGDVMAGLKGLGNIEIPKIGDGAFSMPEGALKLPDGSIQLPKGTAVPDGAIKLPDGNIKLPEGTATLPPGTVKLPVDGPSQFMDPKGNIYDANGAITQHAKDAPTGKPDADAGAGVPKTDAPKVDSPATAKVPDRELASVGGRGGDDGIRLGSNISDPVHVADQTPGSRPDNTPGGNAPDNMPRNSTDTHTPGASGGRPETPSTGGHADTPSTGGGSHTDGPGTGGSHSDGPGTGGSHTDGPATGDHADHNAPGSASTPADAISPETRLPDPDGKHPAGHGEKLLDLFDMQGPRVSTENGLVTHIDNQPVDQYLDNLAKERAKVYRDAKDAKQFVKGDVGACVGAVIDTRTGIVIEGINGRSNNVIPLDKLHPTLRGLYEEMAPNKPHVDHPLGHAEVKATNELLWARTRLGLPSGVDAMKEIRAAVEFPFNKNRETGLPGKPAPFCANCYHMLPEMPTTNGRFTAYPADDSNWIP